MRSGNKIWSTVVDYFLILGAVIGVGFASGKEIYAFFFKFGRMSVLGLVSFGLLYIFLFYFIEIFKRKMNLHSFSEFNKKVFGNTVKVLNIILYINFTITSAGMLAGADYLFGEFLNVGFRLPTVILSVLTFLVLLGGIDKVKLVANIIVPLMLAILIVNGIKNITPNNVNLSLIKNSFSLAIIYGLLFGVNNFVVALPMVFETKLKFVGKTLAILTICGVILINILVLASNNFYTDMPMFELSRSVSESFYFIYFLTLILALFSTLLICSYNAKSLLTSKKSIFASLFVVLLNAIISNFGYTFIVEYLYVVSGALSGFFIVVLLFGMFLSMPFKHDKFLKFNPKFNYLKTRS